MIISFSLVKLNKEAIRAHCFNALVVYISKNKKQKQTNKTKSECIASSLTNQNLRTTNHKQPARLSQISNPLSDSQSINFLALVLALFCVSPGSCPWRAPNSFRFVGAQFEIDFCSNKLKKFNML